MADNTTRIKERLEFTRRDHLKGILGGSAALAGFASGGSASADGTEASDEEVTVSEGTNIALTASPNGESIVMDLHGFLFHLPREGGEAERLTDVELEPARPDYGPTGERIALQSYADGQFDIWTMASDTGDLQQVTTGFWDDREPQWSPDGQQIAFSSDRGGQYDIWSVDIATGALQQWTDDSYENFEPTWSPDGTEIAYVTDPSLEDGDDADNAPIEIQAVDRNGNTRTLAIASGDESFNSPSWSPDGENIAYVRTTPQEGRVDTIDLMVSGEQVTSGEDVFIFTPHWLADNKLLYTADGTIRVLELDSSETTNVPFTATFDLPTVDYEHKSYSFDKQGKQDVQGILTPSLSPDGMHLTFIALNDLWVMSLGQSPRRITNDSFYQADPSWSPDSRYLVYSSDETGVQNLYVHDTQTGSSQQITTRDDAAFAASWSPDGSRIAFQNQDGATFTVEVETDENEVETGEVREVIGELFRPSRPTWSNSGDILAMAALKTYSNRFREGTSQILTVNIETGEKEYHPPGDEFDSISTRDHDGPVWSPDGRWMAFIVESTLRVMPVNEVGEPTGPAKQITDEATDAPTWCGDSQWLLYLNNGQLKKVSRDGSETREIPVPLTYQPAKPAGRTVIYAGRLWDGTSSDIKENVTIEVVNNRIQTITSDSQPPSKPHIDAANLTVIPGLWDTHVHQTYAARSFGDRQGRINLAYGITSTVSAGDYVYRAVEEREALQSGNRVGPRFFATGEALDGSRVYSITRPITSLEQIPLEMSRARELEFDYAKTYVRLNGKRMAEIEDYAHEEFGVPTGSHSFSPGIFVGQDGTTHLSGTQRLGYARTESATHQTYSDVVELYGQGKRSVHTTFFNSDFLLADEIAADPRMQLFPTWRYEALQSDVAGNAEFPAAADCNTAVCRYATTFNDISEHGGVVLLGTDTPFDHLGISLHANLRPLVELGGFSPYEALITATRLPAEHQGVDENIGTLEQGKLADMVFVEGNPLEQIEDAMQVRMTMKGGELYTTEDLIEPFKVTETDDADDIYQGPGDDDDGNEIDDDGDGAVDEDDEDKDDDDDSDGNNRDDDGDGMIDEDGDQN